jgi:hypothetical protein
VDYFDPRNPRRALRNTFSCPLQCKRSRIENTIGIRENDPGDSKLAVQKAWPHNKSAHLLSLKS